MTASGGRRWPCPCDVLGRDYAMVDGTAFIVTGWLPDTGEIRCRTPEGSVGRLPIDAFVDGLDAGAIVPAPLVRRITLAVQP